jgi:hypothetical protein
MIIIEDNIISSMTMVFDVFMFIIKKMGIIFISVYLVYYFL